MVDLAQALAQSDKLIDWYWQYGRQRKQYHLPAKWLVDLYRQRDSARALLEDNPSGTHKVLAVWGPSGSGKSMLLSDFLDAPDGPASALTWKDGEDFRFKPVKDYPDIPIFNPRKEGTDASGCVTRFYLAERIADPDHPVEINLASRRQIMQAIAAGYLNECQLVFPPNVDPTEVDEDFVRDELGELGKDADGTPDREAVERIVDVVAVIDRLLLDEYQRFSKLKTGNWEELRGALIANPALSSSRDQAERIGRKLLWDDRPKLNDLAATLEVQLDRITDICRGLPIMCSLQFAAHLVDIDTFALLSGVVKDSPERVEALRKSILEQTTYTIRDGKMVIGSGPGKRLFSDIEDFGLFQGLVWELAVPLNASFFGDERRSAARSLLSAIEILDVPGVAKAQRGVERYMLNLDAPEASPSELLSKVLKRGRTATIINRYGEQARVDGLLLLNVAGAAPSQPAQLIAGVETIWRSTAPAYDPATGARPPIPLALCLTFVGQKINENVKAGLQRMNLGSLGETLAKLGDLVRPGVCQMYVTTYPEVPGAAVLPECKTAEVRDAILRQPWVQTRFQSAAEKASWRAVIEDSDGGVSHLLRSLTAELALSSREARIAQRAADISTQLTSLIQAAAPIRDEDGRRHSRALIDMAARLSEILARSQPRDDVGRTMSWQLRRLMAFEADEFDPVSEELLHERGRCEEYVKRQLDRWATRIDARQVLAEFGVDDQDQIMILDALRQVIDVPAVADWMQRCIVSVKTLREKQHMRRYVAAKCAELLNQPEKVDGELLEGRALERDIHAKLARWSDRRRPEDSPYYDAVIAPTIDRLKEIARRRITNQWDEVGDDDIIRLQAEWRQIMAGDGPAARVGNA
jgi:hypothetical protein